MKYLEEIFAGECFAFMGKNFILTIDFKKNGDRLAICLSNGLPQWIKANDIIEEVDIFTLDKENNIVAIKERKKNVTTTNTDVS